MYLLYGKTGYGLGSHMYVTVPTQIQPRPHTQTHKQDRKGTFAHALIGMAIESPTLHMTVYLNSDL